jgi:hypothetical protein
MRRFEEDELAGKDWSKSMLLVLGGDSQRELPRMPVWSEACES